MDEYRYSSLTLPASVKVWLVHRQPTLHELPERHRGVLAGPKLKLQDHGNLVAIVRFPGLTRRGRVCHLRRVRLDSGQVSRDELLVLVGVGLDIKCIACRNPGQDLSISAAETVISLFPAHV